MLGISDVSAENEKAIVFKKIDKVYGPDSFKVYTEGENLLIEYAFSNMLTRAVSEFLNEKITRADTDTDLSGVIYLYT